MSVHTRWAKILSCSVASGPVDEQTGSKRGFAFWWATGPRLGLCGNQRVAGKQHGWDWGRRL